MYLPGFRSLFRERASPVLSAIALVSVLLLASFLAGFASGRPAFPSPTGGSGASPPSSPTGASSPSVSGSSHVTPAVQRVTGTFYENNSTFADLPQDRSVCQSVWFNSSYNFSSPPYTYYEYQNSSEQTCYSGAQNPSTLSLGGNEIGVGYSVLSNQSMVGCSNHPDVETSQVGFIRSFDSGQEFGAPVWIGNTSCAYLNALEPSFTLSSNGNIYGAFVEANYGNGTNYSNGTNTVTAFQFGNRSADALAFTSSSNSGASFSSKTLGLAGSSYIARPVVAAFGQSVYIVYENLDNNSAISLTTSYPYPAPHPIALEALSSTDGGVTWSGPYTLPGLNASAGYSAMSPAIAVNSAGKIAVAYATNRSCFELLFGFCNAWGESVVASTSLTNGTSWSAPVLVSPNVTGEYPCAGFGNDTAPNYWFDCYAYMFQWEPAISVAWSDVNANNLYVAWSGGFSVFNATDLSTYYGTSAVWSAASNDGGGHWNDSVVAENLNQFYPEQFSYNPSIGVRNGWVYVGYAQTNDSFCFTGCARGTTGQTFWLATSTNGLTWLANVTLLVWNPGTYTQGAFTGYTTSMGFSSGGPVVTFSDPTPLTYTFGSAFSTTTNGTNIYDSTTYWDNYTGHAALTTAFVWSGNTTIVNFTETGLPAGTRWSFSLGSATFASASATVQVRNVPAGPGLAFAAPNLPDGFWTRFIANASVNSSPIFTHPTTVTVAFLVEYGISFSWAPLGNPFFQVNFVLGGVSYYFAEFGCGPTCVSVTPEFPWYFTNGTVIDVTAGDVLSTWPISFWTGTGNGSSTNFGNSTTFTVNGVVNETGWAGAYGTYNVTFVPLDLPSGTAYNFTFNGSTYSALAPGQVTVPHVVTGTYVVSSIQAPGTGGYEYFGQVPGGDQVYIPATPVVDLNFSYAYVDLGAPPGIVSFQAIGLGAGDPWQMALNGTTYASATPWVNLTTRPGTFAVSADPVPAAANDTAQYTPTGFGPTQTVAVGSTYPVTFVPTYRVDAVASAGGTTTSPGSHWFAVGALTSFIAQANANYRFLGWTGTGPGSYSGPGLTANITVNGPILESANFMALPVARFALTFNETGLSSGVWWTVQLNGYGYSSSGASLLVPNLYPCSAGSAGTYTVAVPTAYLNGTSGIRFVPSGYPTSICTTGTTQVTFTFTEQYLVTPVTTGGGTAAVQVNGVPQSTSAWVTKGTTAGIEAQPASGYAFSGWVGEGAGNYTGPALNDELTPSGPITEVASFALIIIPPLPTYNVDFHAGSGLVAGTPWMLTFNGTAYASTSAWINVSGLEVGSYSLTVPTVFSSDHLTEFVPTVATTSLRVVANLTDEAVAFTPSYYVSVHGTQGGTVVSPVSGWVASGKTVTLNATPNVGYLLVGWTGTGTGSYSGSVGVTTLTVTAPITEVATFAPVPAAAPANNGLGSNSTAILIGLAVAGLVIGLAVGYVAFRRRSGAAPPAEESTGGSG